MFVLFLMEDFSHGEGRGQEKQSMQKTEHWSEPSSSKTLGKDYTFLIVSF